MEGKIHDKDFKVAGVFGPNDSNNLEAVHLSQAAFDVLFPSLSKYVAKPKAKTSGTLTH